MDTLFKKESSVKFNTWTNKGWHEVTDTNTTRKKKTIKRGGLFKKKVPLHTVHHILIFVADPGVMQWES